MSRAASTPSRPIRHLLVVDDEPHIGLLLRPELEGRGFRVTIARSLADARATVDHADAMLLDLHLPDGSGMDFLRELRTRPGTQHLPVLILTGETGDQIVDDVRQLGASLLTKPFSPSKLSARLTALVNGGAPVVEDAP